MDANTAVLKEKLETLLQQATNVASQILTAERVPGTPHFDQIELPAHALGGLLKTST